MSDRTFSILFGIILGIAIILMNTRIPTQAEPTVKSSDIVKCESSRLLVETAGERNCEIVSRVHNRQPEEMRFIIQQARDAWVKGDAEAFASLFSPDGEFIVPGNRWVGREAIQKIAADFATSHSEVKIEIKRIIVESDRAVAEWHWEDRENATGRLSKADDAIVVDFQAGQIVRWREYIDTATWADR